MGELATHGSWGAEFVLLFDAPAASIAWQDALPRLFVRQREPNGAWAVTLDRRKRWYEIGEHLDDLWARLEYDTWGERPDLPRPDGCVLRVVQSVMPDHGCGSGFHFESKWIDLVARFGGRIEVCQYDYRDLESDPDDRVRVTET